MDQQLADVISGSDYNIIDVGCSSGGSINFAMKKLKGKPLGIDVDPEKIATARSKGYNVIEHNVLEQPLPMNAVRYCTLFHVLEHLPGFDAGLRMVLEASRAATDAVLIRTPNFDDDAYLAKRGLKFYHSDWSGHTFHVTTLDYIKIIDRIKFRKLAAAKIYGKQRITGMTSHLVPVDAPINTRKVDSLTYPQVDTTSFPDPLYKETAVIILLGKRNIEKRFSQLEKRMHVDPADCRYTIMPNQQDAEAGGSAQPA